MTSPKARSAVTGREDEEAPPRMTPRGGVLLIDDDAGSLESWRRLLADAGFAVDAAASGAAGLARARQRTHQVIVLDLRLPDMDGLSVLSALREQLSETPVLIVTGFATHESTARAFRLGAADVLEKPLGDQLVDAVRELAGNGSARRPLSPAAASELSLLLAALWQIANARPCVDEPTSTDGATDDVDSLFIATLVRVLTRPDLRVQALPACSAVLRETIEASDARQLPRHAERLADRVATAFAADTAWLPASVADALAWLDEAIRAGRHPIHESTVARALALHPTHLGRLLKAHLGLGFRQVRRLVRARRALLLVVDTDEQLAQIAYSVGYPHPSQLDRDFRALFGAQPGVLRQRVRPRFLSWRTLDPRLAGD
jgi:DNA-binding response OmpR family regulator/AraC-like DNA-binding protein